MKTTCLHTGNNPCHLTNHWLIVDCDRDILITLILLSLSLRRSERNRIDELSIQANKKR